MKMNAIEYTRFLSEFNQGGIVSPAMVAKMKAGRLGFDALVTAVLGDVGPLHPKEGAADGYGRSG